LELKYTPVQSVSDNKTITASQPVQRRTNKQTAGNSWIIDQDGDAFGPFIQTEAERLRVKLGGQHQARVYEGTSRAEANEQHRQFLIRVARGHDAW
jgi:hypothetical protein